MAEAFGILDPSSRKEGISMSAQDLSFGELGDATRAWTEEPDATFLNTHPVSAPFMARFAALRALVTGATTGDSELAQLTEDLGIVDADHDEAVRFIVGFLAAFAHYDDPEVAAAAKALLMLLIPEGAALVRMSYAEEAGRVEYRESVLTPEVRDQLAAFPLPAGRTLADKLTQLQELATLVGSLLERRRKLEGAGTSPSGMDLLNARRALIALVEQIFRSFRMLGDELDDAARAKVKALEASWERAVRDATQRADRRRANAKAKKGAEKNDPEKDPAAV